MIRFDESINDKNILKCIFFCGIPGAGKTTVSDLMFKNDLSVKVSDTDTFDNLGMYKSLINKDRITGVNVIKILSLKRKIDAGILKTDKNYWTSDDRNEYRIFSNYLLRNQNIKFINSMLPIVIMGTGLFPDKIKRHKTTLEKIGYECSMVYVSCNTETALYRNYMRNRTEDPLFIQTNIEKYEDLASSYQAMFKDNFFEIQNNKEVNLLNLKVKSSSVKNKIFNSKISNPIGKELISYMKANNLKYLSDFYIDLYKFYDNNF